MQKYRKSLVVFWLDKMCHFDNLIGGKILFRFNRKYAQKTNVKFGVNKWILFFNNKSIKMFFDDWRFLILLTFFNFFNFFKFFWRFLILFDG